MDSSFSKIVHEPPNCQDHHYEPRWPIQAYILSLYWCIGRVRLPGYRLIFSNSNNLSNMNEPNFYNSCKVVDAVNPFPGDVF